MVVEYNGQRYYLEKVEGSQKDPKPCYLCDRILTQARSRCDIPVCLGCQRQHFPQPPVKEENDKDDFPVPDEDPWEGEDTPVMWGINLGGDDDG